MRRLCFLYAAWNDDATRMPYRMHSEYLRKLYLGNQLAHGQYRIGDRPVTLDSIDVPIFCVSTTSDHIAPWQSVYKLHLLTEPAVTFVLTSGGHNAGIVSEPGHKGRSFRIHTTEHEDLYLPPEEWQAIAERREDSWWPALIDWLNERSGAETAPPGLGAGKGRYQPLENAPGTYVHQR